MKHVATIFLLFLLAFNWGGYQVVMDFIANRTDMNLQAQIDQNKYDEAQLIEIRVPINLPYVTDQPEFQKEEGEIEANGVYYRYVEKKIVHGELILKCISNEAKKEIKNATDNYAKNTIGFDGRQDGKKQNHAAKMNLSDMDCNAASLTLVYSEKGFLDMQKHPEWLVAKLSRMALSIPEPPPKAII